jgi:hypothetical protein
MQEIETDHRLIDNGLVPRPLWSVAIYLVDREYGGAEEGGWYYDAGVKVTSMIDGMEGTPFPEHSWNVTFASATAEELANQCAAAVQQVLDITANARRRPISSVLSTGRYEAMVFEGMAPDRFPEETPHYE